MKTLEGHEFRAFYDRDSGRVFSGMEFRRCRFYSSRISIARDPSLRSTVRDIILTQCEEWGCALGTAVVENVVIDGLKTSDLFQTWGAVFKHVTLKGKLGRIMISPFVATGRATPEQQRAFDQINADYYSTGDCALHIAK